MNQNKLLEGQNQLLENQNKKFDIQNERLNFQNNLIEADRRSSLVFLMSNVLDKVDDEIKEQERVLPKNFDNEPDAISFNLSDPLIGRIIALSKAFRPYKILASDSLTNRQISPERGQLFIALFQSNLDISTQKKITSGGDFANAHIGKVDLSKAYLKGIRLRGADFTENNPPEYRFSRLGYFGSNLQGVNLQDADLRDVKFNDANLREANLYSANLRGANLYNANLIKADLRHANLCNSDLRLSVLTFANLEGAMVRELNWIQQLKEDSVEGAVWVEANYYVDESMHLASPAGSFYHLRKKK